MVVGADGAVLSMRMVAVIQARVGSTRLPGKVLADVCGVPLLWYVIARTRLSDQIDHVVVACPATEADEAIINWCLRHDVSVVCGPEHDVLTRYVMAAELTDADLIVRITADCPLIDPWLIDETIHACDGERWASNVRERTWPDGLDVEVMTRETLMQLSIQTQEPADREHVTTLLYRKLFGPGMCVVKAYPPRPDLRWTVDTRSDLDWVREVYRRVPWNASTREILHCGIGERRAT